MLKDARVLLATVAIGIVAGTAAHLLAGPDFSHPIWGLTSLAALIPLALSILRQLLRGHVGVDLIALLAIGGALLLGEFAAGAVIALMLTGGQALEARAARRARRDLTALLERAPRTVHRYEQGRLTRPDLAEVRPRDRLLVRPGEVVPVDGVLLSQAATLDESALTGESRPVSKRRSDQVLSGTVNAGGPFDLQAIATAEESTYAGIVRLVKEAQESKAPFVRLADRYALLFLPVTLLVAGAAWAYSGDPIRALAVLVVATPCPLILAAPVAIVSGTSLAARRGIIVKGGGVLERLARSRTLLLDKTGTVTAGISIVSETRTFDGTDPETLLRLAAGLAQVSPHVHSASIVNSARERNLPLAFPEDVQESPGMGVRGVVEGRSVSLGREEWIFDGAPLPTPVRRLHRRCRLEGGSLVFVGVDGRPVGVFLLEDPIRPESGRTLRLLRKRGIRRIVLLTGDHAETAEIVGAAVGVDQVLAEHSPEDKVEAVRREARSAVTVMVGDGINDAPALAAADVGVAMGARGATASSQAADVVLTLDRLDRVADALWIARRSRGIALQSVLVGMGLSLVAMLAAAAGYLTPLMGALLQEGIDVLVILNALRVLNPGPLAGVRDPGALETGRRVRREHRHLFPELRSLRETADRLDFLSPDQAQRELEKIVTFLEEELLPHEASEDARMYPVVARLIGGEDPTGIMSRAHREIEHFSRVFSELVRELSPHGPRSDDLPEIRRLLYGLYALLRVHFAQEEEHYLSLIEDV